MIIGEVYKKGNSTVIETFAKPATEIAAGLAVEKSADGVAVLSSGIACGVSGRTTNATMSVIKSGLEVAVQVDDVTIADGEAVYVNKTSHKFTNVSTDNTAVNAVFRSVKDDAAKLIAANGNETTVKGALIEFVGGL